jgi:early secretory antigenic target protein ESAT-6
MSYNVTFDTEDIANKAAAIQTAAGEIETQLTQLTIQMGALAETYTGAGASAFQEVYAQWKITAAQMKEELGEIGVALGNTGQARGDVEQQIAGQWASAL